MLDKKIIIENKIETKELAKAIGMLAANNLKPENIKVIKDRDGNIYLVQVGLFSHAQKCNSLGIAVANVQKQDYTRINLIGGSYLVVALETSEVAKMLGFQLDE